jgi:hypothetical protein
MSAGVGSRTWRLCGVHVTSITSTLVDVDAAPERYIAYFENAFGEQFEFVHDDGDADATLYAGDVDWEPRLVSDASGLPDVGDLILNREERSFLCACWIATAWRREPRRESH